MRRARPILASISYQHDLAKNIADRRHTLHTFTAYMLIHNDKQSEHALIADSISIWGMPKLSHQTTGSADKQDLQAGPCCHCSCQPARGHAAARAGAACRVTHLTKRPTAFIRKIRQTPCRLGQDTTLEHQWSAWCNNMQQP